jgi:hypothetical protein
LLNCRLCDLKHNTLLENKKKRPNGLRTGNSNLLQTWNLTMSIAFVNPNSNGYRQGI